jgi:nitrogen regulatory protein PII
VVEDGMADKAIEVILNHAQTGQIGDGKIFVRPIENAYRIRTGEEGSKAI